MMARRWVWLALALAAVIAGVGFGVVAFGRGAHPPKSDCQVVRELIAYNKSQTEKFNEELTTDTDHQSSVAEYQPWADRLHGFASQIEDPALKEHVDRFTESANRMVDLVRQGEAGQLIPQNPLAPIPIERYRDVVEPMHNELVALDNACPAP